MLNEEIVKRDYIDPITAAGILNISRTRVNFLCRHGRFEGAIKTGWSWLIPKVSVNNFRRLKGGKRPKQNSNIDDKTTLNNVLNESENNNE